MNMEVLVYFFKKFLWFGMSMDHSLINPNQIQMMGMSVSDDPFDEDQKTDIVH